jgi:hypothetical protein
VSIASLLGAISIPVITTVGGVPITVTVIPRFAYDVEEAIRKREAPPAIAIRFAWELFPILMTAANVYAPPVGFVGTGLYFMVKYGKQPTPEEQQRMWDQAQGVR